MAIRKLYRRLPLLTSTIVRLSFYPPAELAIDESESATDICKIFLGCPQGSEPKEFLEDQLFGLMSLPGPPVRTRILQKISSLTSQIERINLEFLETNVLDRSVVAYITSAPKEQAQTDVACEPQAGNQSTGDQNKVVEQTADTPQSPLHLFPIRTRCMPHNSGIFYTAWWDTTDHLGLVRNHGSSGSGWVSDFVQIPNASLGWSKL